jgi:hypothetical protein
MADEIKQTALKEGWAYKLQIHPLKVGVHKQNRGGFGCSGSHSHEVGLLIDTYGFSWPALADAQCCEDDDQHSNEKFTINQCQHDELLPQYTSGMVDFASLASGHANQLFGAMIQQRPSTIAELSVDGKLSKDKFLQNHPQAASVFTDGIMWTVYRKEAISMYPEIPAIVEQAMNLKNKIYKSENSISLLNRAVVHIITCKHRGINVDIDMLRLELERYNPQLTSEIPNIINFAMLWAGSDKTQWIDPLLAFIKAFTPADFALPSHVFGELASMKVTGDEVCPAFVYAVVKTAAASKEKKTTVTSAHIRGLQNKYKAQMIKSNNVMMDLRRLAASVGIDSSHPHFTKLFGKTDVSLVRHCFGIYQTVTYKHENEIAHDFVESLNIVVPDRKVANPYSAHTVPSAPSGGDRTNTQPLNLLEFDIDGKAKNQYNVMLQQHGYKVGTVCTNPKQGCMYTVDDIDDNGDVRLSLSNIDGTVGPSTVLSYKQVITDYKVTAKPISLMKNWPCHVPEISQEWEVMYWRAVFQLAVQRLHAELGTPELILHDQPTKKVFAKQPYKKGSLVLPPVVARVELVDVKKADEFKPWVCKGGPAGKVVVVINQVSRIDLLSPIQVIRHVVAPEKPTVDVMHKAVSVATIYPHPKAKAKAKSEDLANKTRSVYLEIPCIVNTKDLAKHEEVMIAKAVAEKRAAEISVQQAVKKARVEKP